MRLRDPSKVTQQGRGEGKTHGALPALELQLAIAHPHPTSPTRCVRRVPRHETGSSAVPTHSFSFPLET